jgi:putative transposase
MARPPRITPYPDLPLPLVYFVTLIVDGRDHVLNRDKIFRAIRNSLNQVEGWRHPVGMVMPDHLHLLISPQNPKSSVADWSSRFKWKFSRWHRETWRWQSGCFDHLIRNPVSGREKLEYIRANPMRAGLVPHWLQWPYQWGTLEDSLFTKKDQSIPSNR